MFQVITPALKAAAPAAKFAAAWLGTTVLVAASFVGSYSIVATGCEAVDRRIANKRAARANREKARNAELGQDIRDFVNAEIQRQVDAGTLIRLIHKNPEVEAEIKRQIDAGLLVPASCPTPSPA